MGHCENRRGVTYNGRSARGEACRSKLTRSGRAASAWQRSRSTSPSACASIPAFPCQPCRSRGAHALPDFPRWCAPFPLAGLVIGLLPALCCALALLLDLGPWLSAALSVAAMALATGALHEDGLADTADSFGGATDERRLEIMRDSRIGSFGASALILAFALRIGALATLAYRIEARPPSWRCWSPPALSRTAGLMPLVLPAAGPPGWLSQAVGQPSRETFWLAAAIAAA